LGDEYVGSFCRKGGQPIIASLSGSMLPSCLCTAPWCLGGVPRVQGVPEVILEPLLGAAQSLEKPGTPPVMYRCPSVEQHGAN
jgi:uncharacterized membrane protein YraQ (UPF0718 family)